MCECQGRSKLEQHYTLQILCPSSISFLNIIVTNESCLILTSFICKPSSITTSYTDPFMSTTSQECQCYTICICIPMLSLVCQHHHYRGRENTFYCLANETSTLPKQSIGLRHTQNRKPS